MRRVLSVTPFLVVFLFYPAAAMGQSAATSTSTSANKATCKIDKTDPTEADIARFRREKKAVDLYADFVAKHPEDGRAHLHQIDSLLAQRKLEDARKALDPWTESTPKDPYAIAAAADVRFAEGDWLESYALNLKALAIDPCNADAWAGSAQFESLSGYRVTARKHFALAHQLEPNDEDIREDWIFSLGDDQRREEQKKFIAESKALDEKRRIAITNRFGRGQAMSENNCALASSNGPTVIPMTPVYGPMAVDHYALEVAFNGQKRLMQIDTGASGFVLTQSAGGSLGLHKAFKAQVGGFGDQGSNAIDLEHADSVRIGGLEFRNCPVVVLSNFGTMGGSHIEGNRMDNSDGIVGSDIFDRYLVTLDYVKHEIRLDPLPQPPSTQVPPAKLDPLGGSNDPDRMLVDRFIAPSMQNWTKIYRDGHNLLMPTRINGTKTKIFEIDTGAFTNLIDTKFAKEITKTQESDSMMMGLSGTSKMGETGSFTVDFAGIRLPVQSMDSSDLSRMGTGISGFFGYPTLSQLVMHIDYRDNLVLFEAPKGKKL